MLVLARKTGEYVDLYIDGVRVASVCVGERIGRATRLGFEAGPEVMIVRRELRPIDEGRAAS